METIFTTVGFNASYSIIPDTLRSLMGFSTNSKGYSILKADSELNNQSVNSYRSIHDLKANPTYVGYITIEEPGNTVSYEYEGQHCLDHVTVDELVDVITYQQMLDSAEACS